MSARGSAYKALKRVASDGSYSSLALDAELERSDLDERDRRLAAGIFYGVMENAAQLDYIIGRLLSKPGMKLEKDVRILLRMGIYQLAFMDRVPDSAAVDETVTLAKKSGLSRASGFINGVLRAYIRSGKSVELPERSEDPVMYLSLKYSCPEWIIRLWNDDYGEEICERILECLPGRPPLYARINEAAAGFEEVCASLRAQGAGCEPVGWMSGAVELTSTGSVEKLRGYADGQLYVQDLSSQFCCTVLDPQSGDAVLDVCAAPGGKSFTSAVLMKNRGRVTACDIHPHRVGLIADGAKRLGLSCVDAVVRDALNGSAVESDRVLCDVPCSGLGIIRRKPDIRNKKPETLAQLPQMQYDILKRSSQSVKKGGTLVYSTCTLRKAENQEVVKRFLADSDDFEPYPFGLPDVLYRAAAGEPEHMLTLFPFVAGSDGFFIARMKRKG